MSEKKGVAKFRKDISVYRRMIRLLDRCDRGWRAVVLSALVEGIYPFIAIYLSSLLLDALYQKKEMKEIMALALAGAAVAFAFTGIKHFFARQKNIFWWGLQHQMAEPLMQKTMEMDYELTENGNVRAMRMRQDENRRRERDIFERFLEQLALLVAAGAKLVFSVITVLPFLGSLVLRKTGRESALFLAAALAVLLLCFWGNYRSVRRQGRNRVSIHKEHADENRLNDYMMNHVVLSIEAGKDIRIFQLQKMMENYGNQMNRNWRRMTVQYASNDVCHLGLQGMLSSCVGGIVYLYVAVCGYLGIISVGSVVRYAGAVQQLIQSVTDLLSSWGRLQADRDQMEDYFQYLDLPNRRKQGNRAAEDDRDGYVFEFQNVSFRYPGADSDAIRNLNLTLPVAGHIAVVGRNGSGKTTFIKLLCRLYEPTEGTIRLNGTDIGSYEETEYRKLFSVVFQDFHMFAALLGENISGGFETDEGRARDALCRAGLETLYEQLPDGMQTMLNMDFANTGRKLSGGETQKLALARAIYKDAPLVILDEPTAALDPVSENEIYEGFHEIARQKPVLFISHRLSSCRFTDEILVFDEGNIIQRGSHERLKDEDGLYRRMWDSQARFFQTTGG
ncbi:MAG: ABC transporter ATP-binding protein [Eubacteriales bacterium]|nr:ABC transporter ATP-binding protein [Eubacteriales bacterium]